MPLHVSSTCAHHQEVKTVLYSIWYHHTYRWPSRAQVERGLVYRCGDTRRCIIQFWPPDDEHMCSKHVEAWNKLIVKQKFCASSWLITKINVAKYYLIVIIASCLMYVVFDGAQYYTNLIIHNGMASLKFRFSLQILFKTFPLPYFTGKRPMGPRANACLHIDGRTWRT